MDTPNPFVIPFAIAQDLRDRRYWVSQLQAEMDLKSAVRAIVLRALLNNPQMDLAESRFVEIKVLLVRHEVAWLEEYVDRYPRSNIAPRLETVKQVLAAIEAAREPIDQNIMANQQPHPRQIQAQLQALGDEILEIRERLGPAMQESNRLRMEGSNLNARAIGNDDYISSLAQRLRRAEFTQQQLLDQAARTSPQMTVPVGRYDSSHGAIGRPMPPPPPAYGTSPGRSSPFLQPPPIPAPASYGSSFSRGPPPLADSGSPTTPRASSANPKPLQQKKKTPGSKDNADYLPMVIESIMANRKRFEGQGTLGVCNHTETHGNRVEKCSRPGFDVQCFQEDHIHFCRKHMRVIPGGLLACSHADKANCIVTSWEEREDWEIIVAAAFQAGNLGRKEIDKDDLMQGLFPPQLFPHRYM
ncbi:hypothetical protein N0V83_005275 [Neocucurbitaria cava]|uniref:Uncharacterized protein n=1 Tax=Neocucurbitaria cava TaxID=798079 RepID=A0A9W9CMS1_9PLEO|nr:hypothetical protein N0V83_005275 [Neocucurbitaria cava]